MTPLHLPAPERDVPACRDPRVLAPQMQVALAALLVDVPEARVVETLRTPERQSFLYGFGRDYDDGRGIVTQAPTQLLSWHGFALAADVVHRSLGWDVRASWFLHLGTVAESHGLAWGGRWRHPDLPHLQWGRCPATPTAEDRRLAVHEGLPAVWRKYGAQ
jgi:peptidoglycan L-alanyl-D-glutamate endopeptidase CwlK